MVNWDEWSFQNRAVLENTWLCCLGYLLPSVQFAMRPVMTSTRRSYFPIGLTGTATSIAAAALASQEQQLRRGGGSSPLGLTAGVAAQVPWPAQGRPHHKGHAAGGTKHKGQLSWQLQIVSAEKGLLSLKIRGLFSSEGSGTLSHCSGIRSDAVPGRDPSRSTIFQTPRWRSGKKNALLKISS